MPTLQRRVVLAAYPEGAPTTSTFRIEQAEVPAVGEGQVLLRVVYLSLDPYMRGRITGGPSYGKTVSVGETMLGEALCRVIESRAVEIPSGALVLAHAGWQQYAVLDAAAVTLLDAGFSQPSHALGVLGMPGMTAYIGLFDIGEPKPGETLVVSAATGAVGSVVGQLAKLQQLRVIGIAGGPEKCAYAVNELGFDACLDHREHKLADRLRAACPHGVDIYFENVGGKVFAAVSPLLNAHARVPLCGYISRYNRDPQEANPGPDRSERLLLGVLFRRLRLQGFIVSDQAARRGEFLAFMKPRVQDGRVKTREHMVHGLENAPAALTGLLEGHNFGKLLVQVSSL